MIEVAIAFLILYGKFRERLWDFNFDSLNNVLIRKENKSGIVKWGIIQSGLIMLVLFLYVRPSSHCAFMGKFYAIMASSPFGFDPANPVPHRMLTSLISFVVGMRGQLVIITNLLFAMALLFVIYRYFRKIKSQPADAFMISAVIGFSFVTINTIYYGGYNDSLSFLLIFLMWALRKNRIEFYLLFFLGLLNRETAVFLIPWFALISFENVNSKAKRAGELMVGFGITLGLYLLFRYWISQNHEIEYSAGFYIGKFIENPLGMLKYHFNNLGLGLFAVFKVMWVVPIAAAIIMWRRKDRYQFYGIVLLVLCAAMQLPLAYDTTRLLTLGFMVMPVSLYYLFQTNEFEIRKWILPLFVFNLLVPNINVAGLKIDLIHSLVSYTIGYYLR